MNNDQLSIMTKNILITRNSGSTSVTFKRRVGENWDKDLYHAGLNPTRNVRRCLTTPLYKYSRGTYSRA